MKVGKISENILKRSVIKQIKNKRDEVLIGAGVGRDCTVVDLSVDEVMVLSTDPITGALHDIGALSINVAINDIAASGAEPIGVMISILLPEHILESDLKGIMQQIEDTCCLLNIQVMGGHTEVSKVVSQPIITVTGIGKVKKSQLITSAGARVAQDVVLSKWIALEGTSIIAKEREKELLSKFSPGFIETAKKFDRYLSVVPEAATAAKSGVSAMHDVTEGGIFGALWELAEASGVGLLIDLKKLSIKQETIEICEFYELNPYMLMSSGCMLMTVDNGYDLVRNLESQGIHAVVIGKITDGNDRVVIKEDERRFLEPPKSDELYKMS